MSNRVHPNDAMKSDRSPLRQALDAAIAEAVRIAEQLKAPRRLDFDDVLVALQHVTDNDRPPILRFVAASLDDNLPLGDYTRCWLRAQLRDLAELLEAS